MISWEDALQEAKTYSLCYERDVELLLRLCWLGLICTTAGCNPEEFDEEGNARAALLVTAIMLPIRRPRGRKPKL